MSSGTSNDMTGGSGAGGGGHQVNPQYAMEALGLRFLDPWAGNLCHCAANDAVFELQMLLAFNYLDAEQVHTFWSRGYMPWLRYTWVGSTVDACNPNPRPAAKLLAQAEDHLRDPNAYT